MRMCVLPRFLITQGMQGIGPQTYCFKRVSRLFTIFKDCLLATAHSQKARQSQRIFVEVQQKSSQSGEVH